MITPRVARVQRHFCLPINAIRRWGRHLFRLNLHIESMKEASLTDRKEYMIRETGTFYCVNDRPRTDVNAPFAPTEPTLSGST